MIVALPVGRAEETDPTTLEELCGAGETEEDEETEEREEAEEMSDVEEEADDDDSLLCAHAGSASDA